MINKLESSGSDIEDYTQYQDDPVGFCEDILGETLTDDVKEMMESVRDNPVTVAMSANATGKSHGSSRVAIWWYKSFQNSQVYTAAAPPEQNLRRILWGEISDCVEKHPELFSSDDITALSISRSALSFVSGVTIPSSGTESAREAKFSGKHSEHLLFEIDEGDAVPDEVYRGIESCMSGGHARLLIMFNPRSEQGAVYRMIRDGRANVVKLSAFSHPNVLTGQNIIPGAVDRQTTARRIYDWTRLLTDGEEPGEDCFKLPEFLEGTKAKSLSGSEYPPLKPGWYKIMQSAFSYMVLGEYPAQGSTKLISREWIDAARSRWNEYVAVCGEKPPAYTSGIMGLDVAEYGSDSNCACFRYGGYVEKLVTWGGIDLSSTADKAVSEYQNRDVIRVNVDATGVGASIPSQMSRKSCSAIGIKVASRPTESTDLGEFRILRDQLWWNVREWLRTDPGAMLPPDEQLIEELMTPDYRVENGKIRIMKKDTMRELLRRSPDSADALCLTFASSGFFQDCDLT